jgi:hypothetical protein
MSVRESLPGILFKEKLLDDEQIGLIKLKEVLQRSKILTSKAQGIKHYIIEPSLVTLIDIIESLKITSPKDDGKLVAIVSINDFDHGYRRQNIFTVPFLSLGGQHYISPS